MPIQFYIESRKAAAGRGTY